MSTKPISPTTPTSVPKSWIVAREFNQVTIIFISTLNSVMATTLTLVSSLNTDPGTQKLIGIGFGTGIVLVNLVLHAVLQIMISCASQNNQQEQAEEQFVDQQGPPDNV